MLANQQILSVHVFPGRQDMMEGEKRTSDISLCPHHQHSRYYIKNLNVNKPHQM